MRRALLLTVMAISAQAADDVDFRRQDHRLHLGASASIALFSSELYRGAGAELPVGLGALTAMGVGLAKEISDPEFSESDMQANAVGAILGGLTSVTIHF